MDDNKEILCTKFVRAMKHIFQMKNKLKELDVDFIGGQEPLTKEEELAISAFIKADKEKRRLQAIRKTKQITTSKSLQPA